MVFMRLRRPFLFNLRKEQIGEDAIRELKREVHPGQLAHFKEKIMTCLFLHYTVETIILPLYQNSIHSHPQSTRIHTRSNLK